MISTLDVTITPALCLSLRMINMKISWQAIIIVVIIANALTYFQIRELLWNVVWLNKRGKLRKFSAFKKSVQEEQSLISRVSMRYLDRQVSSCHRDFMSWWKFKRVFALVEILLTVSYIGINIFNRHTDWGNVFGIFMLIQALLLFFFMRFQFGLGGRQTKYDRLRMRRK